MEPPPLQKKKTKKQTKTGIWDSDTTYQFKCEQMQSSHSVRNGNFHRILTTCINCNHHPVPSTHRKTACNRPLTSSVLMVYMIRLVSLHLFVLSTTCIYVILFLFSPSALPSSMASITIVWHSCYEHNVLTAQSLIFSLFCLSVSTDLVLLHLFILCTWSTFNLFCIFSF